MNYEEAKRELARSRNGLYRSQPGRDTFLQWTGASTIGLRYHNTNVVIWYEDGRVRLDSGTFRTVTTKERMNRCSLVNVYQQDFAWFVRALVGERRIYNFRDNMVIGPRGELVSCGRRR